MALGLRSRQVGDCLVPGLLVTASGTALHSAVRASCEGRSDGIAHRWQGPLAGVFADLLACDSLATVAMRALSLLPDRAQVPAAAARYLVPGVLRENLEQLTSVLGARGHERDSARYGMLGRLMRDLPAVAPATSAADCQSVIAPQLRELAERSWFAEDMPPPGLFRLCAELPAFDHRLLTAVNRGTSWRPRFSPPPPGSPPSGASAVRSASSPIWPVCASVSCANCASGSWRCPRPVRGSTRSPRGAP